MPCAARITDKIITGHTCSQVSTIATSLQVKVLIGGLPAAVAGSAIAPHTIRVGKSCVSHAVSYTHLTLPTKRIV